jgi:hypothetical protein
MPRKNTKNIGDLLKTTSRLFTMESHEAPYIPDIMEFCESPAYLGLPFPLYPIQKLVLRAFYRGTPGNTKDKCMNMEPDEEELCERFGLTDGKNGNIKGKWESGETFKEMVLVWGRRSGKDFTISVIALYEAMKLLECKGGDPYKIYNLGDANPFTILTIANNKEQAGILYREIHGKLVKSPYFRDKCIPEGITAGKICLLTPQNKKENDELLARGLQQHPGSVQIETGHSNSNGLVGKGCYVLMLDEAGTYKRSGGPGSDEQLYGNLSPTTKTYVRKELRKMPDGSIERIDHYDGKIISISSPRGMDGVFYRLYTQSENVPHRLMCRLPTWAVNTNHTEEGLRAEEQTMTDEKFRMEFGAEFSGTEGENFFVPDLVEATFTSHQFRMLDYGEPGLTYFAHLDPAISSHNYALAVVHRHPFLNRDTKKVDYHIVLDHMMLWTPEKGKPININKVDEYVIDLHRRFHLGLVSYDQWNSQSSIEKLRKAGIPAICTRFTKTFKIKIYDELELLVNQGRLKCPFHKTLRLEMLHLQRKYLNTGYRIYPKTEGEVKTDDCCDALAAACFNALKVEGSKLPLSRLAYTGIVPSASQHQWRTMSGTLGFGSGQQVWNALTKRDSYPNR